MTIDKLLATGVDFTVILRTQRQTKEGDFEKWIEWEVMLSEVDETIQNIANSIGTGVNYELSIPLEKGYRGAEYAVL